MSVEMAELFRTRWFGSLFIMSAIYFLSVPGVVWVTQCAANDGTIFLDSRENEVLQISKAAGNIASNCGLVSSCTLDCSRAVCNPRTEDDAMSICTKVENNGYCLASDRPASEVNTCKDMSLNYNKSYVTLPKGADAARLQPEVIRDICIQRGLDPTFKNVSTSGRFTWVYFGSTSGVWRAFPGRELLEEGCTSYECRQRPWYLDGISVLKQVMILVDTGNTMGTGVTGEYKRNPGASYLDVAIDISLSFIQTMSPGDYVDVVSFNSTGAYPLGPPVNVGNYTSQSNGDVLHPELEPLKKNVRDLKQSGAPQRSNLTAAIVKAISTFQITARNSLKVVIVISDGYFLPLNSTTFPAADIIALQAKLMIYKLPPNYDDDRFLVNTTLQTVLCGVQGSFEVLDPPATANPLYAISSYFLYLAQIHMIVVGSQPLWSNTYTSIGQVLNTVTVTSPAFDRDGRLVGVAGLDVFLHDLDSNLQIEVLADFDSSGRKRGSLPAPSTFPRICTYQNQTAIQVCNSTTLPTEGIICKQTDTRSLQERVCCNTCAVSSPPLSSHRLEWWKILLIVVLSVAGILGLIFLTPFLCRWCRGPDDPNWNPTEFPGNLDNNSGNQESAGASKEEPNQNS